jgi:hypothetical protein
MLYPLELYAEIDQEIEKAGIARLCNDGRQEFAIDKLIEEYSEANTRSIIVAADNRLREMGDNG